MAPRLTALLFAALCVVAATARPCLKDWTERVEAIEHDFVSHFVQKESDCQSALDIVEADSRLTILEAAVKATGLDDLLDDEDDPFTLFAPTDEAFKQLCGRLKMTEDELLAHPLLLTRILDYHIVPGATIMEEEMDDGLSLPTEARMPPVVGLRQRLAVVRGADDSITIDGWGSDAKVIETDIKACASVIHVVDTVLLPDKLPAQ